MTLGEKIDRALDIADLSITELSEAIDVQPTVEAEPTEEQVKEYCRKRCLVVVSSELFNEMKARWTEATHDH